MTQQSDIVVIGAGIAGISCAQTLAAAGKSVRVLDKGRGIGGRMATRRIALEGGGAAFDHGAQYIRPRSTDFAQVLRQVGAQGWQGDDKLVGVPGMSHLPRELAKGLTVTQQTEITSLERSDEQWRMQGPQGTIHACHVILTIPAPQVPRLLGPAHPLTGALACVQMAPCLTLMAAFPPDNPRPFAQARDPDRALAWIAQDSSKPGRSDGAVTWVAQAGAAFSAQHLEESPDAIAARMLPLLCNAIGAAPDTVLHVQAHRWRYAHATQPLGQPFLRNADRSLHIGGDWCLGARAEDAWHSGRAIARDILEQSDVV